MPVRLVLLDMDGTLLGKSQVAASARNMRAVQRALYMGVHVVPCTGRAQSMLPPQIATQRGMRYSVTSHGARVYDDEAGETIYECAASAADTMKALSLAEGRGIYMEMVSGGNVYLEKSAATALPSLPAPRHHMWFLDDERYIAVDTPSEYFRKHGLRLEKLTLFGADEGMLNAVTRSGALKPTLPGASIGRDFVATNLDKTRAVRALLGRLGISPGDVMAIGDSRCDECVLRMAGVGVAMGNADSGVKSSADFVTGANFEDGVAEAFEKFIFGSQI